MIFTSDFLRFTRAFTTAWMQNDSLPIGYQELEAEQAYLLYYLMRSYRHPVFCQLGAGNGKVIEAMAAVAPSEVILLDVDRREGEGPEPEKPPINRKKGDGGCRVVTTGKTPLDSFIFLINTYDRCDFLYLNSNVNLPSHIKQYTVYFLSEGGYLAINKKGSREVLEYCEQIYGSPLYQPVYDSENLVVFKKTSRNKMHSNFVSYLQGKISLLMEYWRNYEDCSTRLVTVNLGIIAYNHGKHIRQCMEGAFSQKGNFRLKVVIVNDHSTDDTKEQIDGYLLERKDELAKHGVEVRVIHNARNMGATEAIALLVKNLEGADFFSYIEGDDYWCDPNRTANHIKVLWENPECVFSVNSFKWYYESKGAFVREKHFSTLNKKYHTTHDILEKYIGNIGCYFFRGSLIVGMDYKKWKNMKIEWATITMFSCQGDCAYIDEVYNVYRKHMGGTWSTLSDEQKSRNLIKNIDSINRETGYLFDYSITQMWLDIMMDSYRLFKMKYDLVIIDTLNPEKGLLHNDNVDLISGYELGAFFCLQNQLVYYDAQPDPSALVEINSIKKEFPQIGTRLLPLALWSSQSSRLLYLPSMDTAFMCLHIAEHYKIPFVFHLDDTRLGSFIYKDTEYLGRLSRMAASGMFRGVMVSSRYLYQHLVKELAVSPNDIYFIPFGISCCHTEGTYTQRTRINGGISICLHVDAYSVQEEQGREFYRATTRAIHALAKQYGNIRACMLVDEEADMGFLADEMGGLQTICRQTVDSDDFFQAQDVYIAYDLVAQDVSAGYYPALEAGVRGAVLLCPDPLNLLQPFLPAGEAFCPVDIHTIEDMLRKLYENPQSWEQISNVGSLAIERLASPAKRAAYKQAILDAIIAAIDYEALESTPNKKLPLWDQVPIESMPPQRSPLFKVLSRLFYKFCPVFMRPLLIRIKARLFDTAEAV